MSLSQFSFGSFLENTFAKKGRNSAGATTFADDRNSRTALSKEHFYEALDNEWKRAERSRTSFVFMLLQLDRLSGFNGNRGAFAEHLAQLLARISRSTDIVGWYKDDSALGAIFTEVATAATPDQAVGAIRAKVLSKIEERWGKQIVGELSVSVYRLPNFDDGPNGGHPLHQVLCSGHKRPGESSWLQSRSKRVLDVLLSTTALILLAPLMLVVAVAIKLTSPGPVLFGQERIGQDGKKFKFLKFRSMYSGVGSQVHRDYVVKFISGSESASRDGVYKLTQDARITRIGGFLRKTSLDELPQFWNVLQGDMSLVGPRPPLPYEIEAYDLWHRDRFLSAKPGITGLWQVSGRSRVKFDDMVRLDLQYVRNSSFWLDLGILWRTPLAVVQGTGAY